ncbi:MAG: alpha/beta fold hydrolase [Christensenellales bacterium]
MPPETFEFTSAGDKKLHGYKWSANHPKAVLHIVHGAVEHAMRYGDFAEYLNREGITVYAMDLRGHGRTADDPKVPYFSEEEGGWDLLVEDINALTCLIKKQTPDVPVFLLGHSMGSFLAVSYFAKYGQNVKGGILSGAGTNSPMLLRLLIALSNRDIKHHGNKHPSPFIHNLTFGSLNAKIKGAQSRYDFISSDRAVIDAYLQDEYCGNIATSEFLWEMGRGIQRMNDPKTYQSTPKDLPLLFISGEFDPMAGNKHRAMHKIYDRYIGAGLKDVSVIVYKGARHESLNEPSKQKTYRDIAEFIHKRI